MPSRVGPPVRTDDRLAVVGGALLLVLPTRPRRVVAALAGVALGLVAILKLLDMG